jgi:hypothetical protein
MPPEGGSKGVESRSVHSPVTAVLPNLGLATLFVTLNQTRGGWEDGWKCEEEPSDNRSVPARNEPSNCGTHSSKEEAQRIASLFFFFVAVRPAI